MKHLFVVALLLTACERPSKLDASTVNGGGPGVTATGGGNSAAVLAKLQAIEDRLTAIENAHKVAPGAGGDPIAERLHKVETTLARREEAMAFLDMAYAQQKKQEEQQEEQEADPNAIFAVDISGPVKAGQTEGPATAPVTIIKAFDFACPYCQRLNEPLHELVKEYGGKVRVVYMNLLVHPPAKMAHLYSCAAAKQQKYLAWKDAFWEKGFGAYAASGGKDTASMTEDGILKWASSVGLDAGKLKADANGADCQKRLDADMAELQKFRVNATPGLFINGKFISGAIPKDAFKEIIDDKLKVVASSNVPAAQYYDKEIMGKGLHQFRSKREAKGGAPTPAED